LSHKWLTKPLKKNSDKQTQMLVLYNESEI
jgi:hypothetical protein